MVTRGTCKRFIKIPVDHGNLRLMYTITLKKLLMKTFYVLVIFTLFSFPSFSQTNVGGIITSDTEWTLSGSPYTLTSTVGIPNGMTLTIDPGVQVNGNLDLLVKGRIIVNGTAAQPVKFNNTRLIFKSTDLSLSRLTYVSYSNTGANYSNYCGLW